jgi:hypothetical protein
MDQNLRDVILKPIINRCRNHQKRKRGKQNNRNKDRQNQSKTFSKYRYGQSNLGVEGVSTDTLDEFFFQVVDDQCLSTVAEMKQEIMEHVSEVIHPMLHGDAPNWFNQFDMEDINHLLVATDPISLTRTKIMSLPDTLSKMYTVSNKEILPTFYHKDHVWLSLQWNIDGVHNPFDSRPCLSTPCLGKFIVRQDGGQSTIDSLPEMVPITVLELFMEFRSHHSSSNTFCQLLQKMRTGTKEVATSWGLGKDVWGQPKCILCYLKEMFSTMADTKNIVRKEISLSDYRRYMLVQFKGMRPELLVNPEEQGFQYKLCESGVLLPSICAPLPSSVVSLLYQKENGEICIDRLY